MTVGILGTGRMGTALAHAFADAGEEVLLCSARPGRPATAEQRGAPVGLSDLVLGADVVLLAVPFPVAVAFASGPAGRLGAGRTLVDATNPGQGATRTIAPDISGGEVIAAAAPSWQVAKAFNTVPADQVTACRLAGTAVTLPIAGGPAARRTVSALARRLGFAPLEVGGIEAGRHLESLAQLLIGVSAEHRLHGRVGIHIGQPERPAPVTPVLAKGRRS